LLARERARLAEALRQRRVHPVELAEGVDETRLADEMTGFDPDAAAARLAELMRRDEELARSENDLYAERDRRQREGEALETGVGAEEAWQQRRNAEAELMEAARRWAVLKAASALLGGALERHRAARRDPLMTRAGAIFALTTGGTFEGLDQSFDADDELRIVALRRGGERVPVAGPSEGTRDQLYLALRLAYIEGYALRAEAAPFIGDDIFASFDLDRTGHGLEALAAIGGRVQTILFTHHPHVVEVARARLGHAVDIIRIGREQRCGDRGLRTPPNGTRRPHPVIRPPLLLAREGWGEGRFSCSARPSRTSRSPRGRRPSCARPWPGAPCRSGPESGR
jgi:chromosome segregation protein